MNLKELQAEKRKLTQERNDNLELVRSEFNPRINAISSQIDGMVPSKNTRVFSNQSIKATMSAARNMR